MCFLGFRGQMKCKKTTCVRRQKKKNTKTTSELLRLLPLIIAGFQTRLVLLSVLKIKFEEEKCEILDLLPFVMQNRVNQYISIAKAV